MNRKILTKNQILVLEAIGSNNLLSKHFYFTGGTPLAAFYLGHRYSEDLDFFSETEFEIRDLTVFFNQLKHALPIASVDFQQSYNRNLYFLKFPKEVLKIEFTFFPFARIGKGIKQFGLDVDSVEDIAVNKLFTIYQRTKVRDYIDLYLLCKKYGYKVSKLTAQAKVKFDWHIEPLQLASQFVKAELAQDYPRMIKKIKDKDWQNFFIKQAKTMRGSILG